MDDSADVASALSRLNAALVRLDVAVSKLPAAATGPTDSSALQQLEAERDLLQLRHRRLLQSTERAVADIDALINSVGRS
jgi:hypothetical protein